MLNSNKQKNDLKLESHIKNTLFDRNDYSKGISDLDILFELVRKFSETMVFNEDVENLTLEHSKGYFEELIDNINKRVMEYEYLIDNLQIGICAIDSKGIVTEWNSAIEKVYGISKESIIGRPLIDFFQNSINLKVLNTGKKINSKYHEPKEGCQIIITSQPIYYKSKLIGVISIDYSTSQVQILSDQLKIATDTIKDLKRKLEDFEENTSDFFIGNNKIIREQVELAFMVAGTDVPILIYGESGTGKEVFARFIHRESKVEGRFIAVNCSAIPDTLFESEFFGYEKGAFTGASKSGKDGYFKQADSGTLFLDEISELPLQQQSKILRVIQEGRVTPLGSEKDQSINVRIVCATNVDLEEKVKEKKIRIDLYYRLKGIKIEIPPIRNRKEDINSMLEYFFLEVVERYNKKIYKISPKVMKVLQSYHWPGNIREMKNVMRQMVLVTKGEELLDDVIPREIYFSALSFEEELKSKDENIDDLGLRKSMEIYEKHLIKTAIWKSKGNIAKAADILKIPRSTLHYRIEKYGIEKYGIEI